MKNSKKARRWRLCSATQFSKNYELKCKISDRVAIVYAQASPFTWATYGWPSGNGKPHTKGQSCDLLTAKKDARKSLDNLVGNGIYQ